MEETHYMRWWVYSWTCLELDFNGKLSGQVALKTWIAEMTHWHKVTSTQPIDNENQIINAETYQGLEQVHESDTGISWTINVIVVMIL